MSVVKFIRRNVHYQVLHVIKTIKSLIFWRIGGGAKYFDGNVPFINGSW